MSPLSGNFNTYGGKKPWLETWCYFVGFAALIPLLGLPFALASLVLGTLKIERRGGWSLLVFALLGFCGSFAIVEIYYDQVFPSHSTQSASLPQSQPAAGATGAIAWLEPSEGLRLSQSTGKPILYDFTAHWCGWCKVLDEKVFEKPQNAAQINGLFVPVVVMDLRQEEGRNHDDVQELQIRYAVHGFPTLVVQYPNNGPSRKIVGFPGEDQIVAFLTQSQP